MLTAQRLREAQFDHAQYYLQTLQAIETQLRQAGSQSASVLMMDQDLQQIQKAQRWCAAQAETHEKAAQLCMGFGMVEPYVLELRQTPQAQLGWYTAALHSARALKDKHAQVRHLHALAVSFGRTGQYRQGIDCIEEALALAATEPAWVQARLLNALGDLLEQTGESQQASAVFQQSLPLCRPNSDELAHVHWGLANACYSLSQLDEAREHYAQCLALYEQLGLPDRLALARVRLGEIAYTQGQYAEATLHVEQSIAIAQPIGYLRGLMMAYRLIGSIASDQGDMAAAERAFHQSLEHSQRLGDQREHAIVLAGLGRLYWSRGAYDEADAYFRETFTTCEQIGDQMGMAYSLIDVSQVSLRHGHTDQAQHELQQALTILQRLGEPWGQAKVHKLYGDIAQEMGDFAKAVDHFDQMLSLVEGIGDTRGQALACVSCGRAWLALGDLSQAQQRLQRGARLALDINMLPILLEGLYGLALWCDAQGQQDMSLELLGFLQAQPQASQALLQAIAAHLAGVGAAQASEKLARGAQRPLAYFEQHLLPPA